MRSGRYSGNARGNSSPQGPPSDTQAGGRCNLVVSARGMKFGAALVVSCRPLTQLQIRLRLHAQLHFERSNSPRNNICICPLPLLRVVLVRIRTTPGSFVARPLFEIDLRVGCGSKPIVPCWGRCTTHFCLFCSILAMAIYSGSCQNLHKATLFAWAFDRSQRWFPQFRAGRSMLSKSA